jgi:hypothetical protein
MVLLLVVVVDGDDLFLFCWLSVVVVVVVDDGDYLFLFCCC